MSVREGANRLIALSHQRSVHQLAFSVADQILVSGGAFFLIILLTYTLPSDEMGGVGYLLTTYLLVIVLNMSSIFQTGSTLFHGTDRKEEYLATLLLLQLFLGGLLSIIATIILGYLLYESSYLVDNVLLLAIFLFFLVQQIADFIRRISYIESTPLWALMVSLLLYPSRLFVIMLIEPSTMTEVMFLLVASALIPVLFMSGKWISLLKQYAPYISWSRDIIPHFNHSRWLIASSPLMWSWGVVPVFALGIFSGLQNVGAFVSVRSIANIGNVLMELLETIGATTLGKYAIEKRSRFDSYLKGMIILGLCVWGAGFITLWLWGGLILDLVYGEDWLVYKDLLCILWFAQGIIFLFRVNFIVERTKGNTKIVFVAYWAGLLAVLALSPALISHFQETGSAYLLVFGATTIYLSQLMLRGKIGKV